MDPVEREIALHSVIRTDCCGPNFYHFDCMKNATLIRGQEMRCPKCNQPNDQTDFEEKIRRQGIFIQMYNVVDECNGDDSMDGNQLSPCYYSMTRNSAKERSCLSSLGPCTYDETDALDDRVFNPHEALNACISCGIHCHRICAGPPWSCYNPDGEGEEEKWQCEDCR
uniref:PHD domain-containing protein n=1 Tax=Angiostrongylus cantonensis TaxID=6313 RepID=A0A0K0D551_ANGCA